MSRRRDAPPKDPAPVGGTVHRVLRELGYDAKAPGLVLSRGWEGVVGAEAARHCEPVGLRGDLLEIRVDSPSWSHHLGLHRTEILERVAALLPDGAPTRMRTHIG